MPNIFGSFLVLLYLVTVVFHQLEDKSSVHERQQVVEEEGQADVDFLCLLYLLERQQSTVISKLYWKYLAEHLAVQAELLMLQRQI